MEELLDDMVFWNENSFSERYTKKFLSFLCNVSYSRFGKDQDYVNAMRRNLGEPVDKSSETRSKIPVLKLDLQQAGSDRLRNDWQMLINLSKA